MKEIPLNDITSNKSNDENDKEVSLINDDGTNDNIIVKRKWISRTFSKLTPGSLRSAIFSLSILSIGVGALAIPSRMAAIGLVNSLLMIIIVGAGAYITLRILLDKAMELDISQYSKLLKHVFGRKCEIFYDVVVMIYLFGSCIMYQVISKFSNINIIFSL